MDMIIDKDMISISYYSNNEDTQIVLSYIYDNLKNVDGYCITNTKRVDNKDFNIKSNNYIYIHRIIPVNGSYKIDNIDITIEDYEIAKDKIAKINYKLDYFIIKKLVLKSCNKENILKFVENAINVKEKESSELFDKNFSNKIEKKRFSYFDWVFDSAIPKRDLDNIFLKDGQVDKIRDTILSFISEESYKDYVKHGIPYKINMLLHGKPGVGKTSLIHAIASLCDATICNLNINSELSENDMIRAISSASNTKKTSILIIEDIDCIFSDRKDGDCIKNKITMNGILNCLDGFNNPEGLIVIMTTNYPDKLDTALMRSCRIDFEIELTYLDKYQAKNMFMSFFKDDKIFEQVWGKIRKYDIEPSTFMQFLFNNRKNKIEDKLEELYELLEKKKNNQLNKNIYT
jgi:SpoVK/Ycf46/Vps4 family AAA+-type ATPase